MALNITIEKLSGTLKDYEIKNVSFTKKQSAIPELNRPIIYDRFLKRPFPENDYIGFNKQNKNEAQIKIQNTEDKSWNKLNQNSFSKEKNTSNSVFFFQPPTPIRYKNLESKHLKINLKDETKFIYNNINYPSKMLIANSVETSINSTKNTSIRNQRRNEFKIGGKETSEDLRLNFLEKTQFPISGESNLDQSYSAFSEPFKPTSHNNLNSIIKNNILKHSSELRGSKKYLVKQIQEAQDVPSEKLSAVSKKQTEFEFKNSNICIIKRDKKISKLRLVNNYSNKMDLNNSMPKYCSIQFESPNIFSQKSIQDSKKNISNLNKLENIVSTKENFSKANKYENGLSKNYSIYSPSLITCLHDFSNVKLIRT